jgi:hypothetical protein
MSQTKLDVFLCKDGGSLTRILPLLPVSKIYTVLGQTSCLVMYSSANSPNLKPSWNIESVLLPFRTSKLAEREAEFWILF